MNATVKQLKTGSQTFSKTGAAALCSLTLYVASAQQTVPCVLCPCCAEGGHVYPNDGAAYFKARFRLVVFRPFVGEVLVGTLTACTK